MPNVLLGSPVGPASLDTFRGLSILNLLKHPYRCILRAKVLPSSLTLRFALQIPLPVSGYGVDRDPPYLAIVMDQRGSSSNEPWIDPELSS